MLQNRLHLLSGASLAACLALAEPALAAPAALEVAFDIPAGTLETALLAYAAQSRHQILFDPALVEGRSAPGVRGSLTPTAALERLLSGSGLVARQSGPRVFVLKRAGPLEAARAALSPTSYIQASQLEAEATEVAAVQAPPLLDAPSVLEELVITGSLIRGGEPPASPVLRLDREALDRSGRATVADLLSALPQNFAGSATATSSVLGSDPRSTNDLAATGVNLRGLGASATLVLVNGRRMAGTGSRGDFADAAALPTALVDRVEVLLDGASALYGSDAVGGVVNVILKRRMAAPESRLRVSTTTRGGAEDLQASQTAGLSWESGDLVMAWEYGHRRDLRTDERAVTASGDLRPYGGSDRRNFYSHPGNILIFNPAAGAYQAGWAIPRGQSGVGLSPSDFQAGLANLQNPLQGGDILPSEERHNLFLAATQDLGARVRLLADLRYSRRDIEAARPNAVAVFTVNTNNPFFVSPDGSTSHVIGYSFNDEIGPSLSFGRSESLGGSLGAEIEIGGGWRADLYGAIAMEIGRRNSERLVNSRFVSEAVGAIADDPLTAYVASRDGYFNPFGDGAANSPAVLNFIGSGYSRSRNLAAVHTFDAKADGPVIALPAGLLKAAVGVQARQERFKPSMTSLVSGSSPARAGGLTFTRHIEAAFLELRAPLVAPEMAIPGVRRLEASLAGRIERYGDFGETSNPKLGLVWSPAEGLNVRGSYGTSFRAPNMTELNQIQSASPVLIGSGADQTLALVHTGGNRELGPERAKTWSAGFDWAPPSLPGLTASATFFDVTFSDQIGQPVLSDLQNALRNPAYAPFVERLQPGDAGQLARVRAIMAISTNANIGLFPAEAYRAIVDARFVNTGQVRVRGLDFAAAYAWRLGENRLEVAGSGSWLTDFERRFTPTADPVQLVGQAGQPAKLRTRLTGAWNRGPWGASLTLNHVDETRSELGRPIGAWTTADLQLRWTPSQAQGPLSGLSASLLVQNLTDKDPPFYDNPLGMAYDPANADPLGRAVALQLAKRW